MGRWYFVYVVFVQGSIINTGVVPHDVRRDGFASVHECQVFGKAFSQAMFDAASSSAPAGAKWHYHCSEWTDELSSH